MIHGKVKRITELMARKLEIVQVPKNRELCLAIRRVTKEEKDDYTIAVGSATKHPTRFEVSGYGI